MDLVNVLKEKQGDMSLTQFARELGLRSHATISMIYRGQRQPGLEVLRGLARAFPETHRDILSFLSGDDTIVLGSDTPDNGDEHA